MLRRNTDQRQIVFDAVYALGHTTSEELIEYLRQKNSNVSLATIYRNLSILIEDEKVKKIKIGSSDVYETVKKKHYHFQCISCKHIEDMDISSLFFAKMPKNYGENEIIDHDIVFYGYCSICKKNTNIEKDGKENEEVCM